MQGLTRTPHTSSHRARSELPGDKHAPVPRLRAARTVPRRRLRLCARAGLSRAAGDDRGAVRGGRRHRPARPHDGAEARAAVGKIVPDREPAARRQHAPGAGSTTAAALAARAAPDGYTLLMAPSPTMAVSVSIYKHLPYDPATDFVPLALVAQTPFALVVHPSLPVQTVADLIRLAKEKP